MKILIGIDFKNKTVSLVLDKGLYQVFSNNKKVFEDKDYEKVRKAFYKYI